MKRSEVVRLAERFDQRQWDAPHFLRIIDDLMNMRLEIVMMVKEKDDDMQNVSCGNAENMG